MGREGALWPALGLQGAAAELTGGCGCVWQLGSYVAIGMSALERPTP